MALAAAKSSTELQAILSEAEQRRSMQQTKEVLAGGADVKASDKDSTITQLHRALGTGHGAVARLLAGLLMEANGEVTTASTNHKSPPLHQTAKEVSM